MAFTLVVKNTATAGKLPTIANIEKGELAINLADQKLYSRSNTDEIFEIGRSGETPSGGTGDRPSGPSIGDLYYDTDLQALLYWNGSEWVPVGTEAIAIGDLTDVDDTGAANGMVLVYDNGTWKPVSPASLAVEVDLDYTSDGDNAGTVTNSAGDDAVIPIATDTVAGLFTGEEKQKLASIEEGAEANLWEEDSGNLYPVTLSNNVGIGTQTPQSQLTVRGSTPSISLEPTGDTQNVRLQFCTTDGTIQSQIQAGGKEGAAIKFVQGASEAMRISDDGKIGVGTESPGRKFTVNEDGSQIKLQRASNSNQNLEIYAAGSYTYFDGRNDNSRSGFIFRGYNGANKEEFVRITSTGKFGILETNPATELDVNGDITIQNVKGAASLATDANGKIIAADSLTEAEGDARYLRVDAGAGNQTRVAGEATFTELTTHGAGVKVTGGTLSEVSTGFYNSGSGDIRIASKNTYLARFLNGQGIELGRDLQLSTSAPSPTAIYASYVGTGHTSSQDITGVYCNIGNTGANLVVGYRAGLATTIGSTEYRGYFINQNKSDSTGDVWAFYSEGNAESFYQGRTRHGGGILANVVQSSYTDANNNAVIDAGVPSAFNTTTVYGLRSYIRKTNATNAYNIYAIGSAPNFFQGQTEHADGVNVTGGDLTVAPGKIHVLSDESVGVSSNLTSGNTNKAIKAFQVGSQTGVTAEEIYAFQVSGNLNTNATVTTRLAAFQSGISDDGTNTRYNIDIQGNAPNQFKGQTIVSGTDLLDPMNATNGSGIRLNPNGRQETVITSTTASVSCFYMNRNNVSGKDGYFIRFGTDTDFSKVAGIRGNGTGGASFVDGSDYRLKENIVDMPSAVDTVKNLRTVEFNYKDYPGKTRKGFIAHELQQHVAEAVFGTKDETEVIGTVTDWDDTELETEVTEPSAEELTYEEQVEVTPYIAAAEATYDEEGNELTPAVPEAEATYETVTRTKTWTATGDRPAYQGVDQTKLIPILTKALQEALERIEALEAAVGGETKSTTRKKR